MLLVVAAHSLSAASFADPIAAGSPTAGQDVGGAHRQDGRRRFALRLLLLLE
jgi:hypothetical protein